MDAGCQKSARAGGRDWPIRRRAPDAGELTHPERRRGGARSPAEGLSCRQTGRTAVGTAEDPVVIRKMLLGLATNMRAPRPPA